MSELDAVRAERDRAHRACEQMGARITELEKAVADAIDMVLVWGSYADDYSKNKHGFERDLAELRAVLERK